MGIFGKKEDKIEKAVIETEVKTVAKKAKTKTKDSSSPKATKDKQAFHVAKKKVRRHIKRSKYYENPSVVLLRPRITEKASFAVENRTYVFEVKPDATKHDIAHAVEHYYKVKPVKVNLVKIPSKKRRSRNRKTFGVSAVGKKAYVYLKEGDSIEFV